MQVIIDRFESEFAVVELPNKNTIDVPSILFPDAKEGDVIDITIIHDETNKRKKTINELFNKLKDK